MTDARPPTRANTIAANGRKVASLARRHGWAAAWFLLAFGASKAIVVFGPILLARIYPADVYGALELALSTALFLAMLLTGAETGAISRLHLSRSPTIITDVTAATIAAVGAGLLILAAGHHAITGQGAVTLCLLATIPAMIQGALGLHLQVAGKRSPAAWASALATITATSTLAALLFVPAMNLTLLLQIYGMIGCGLVLLSVWAASVFRRPNFRERLTKALSLGTPILAYGLIAAWFAASGRVLIASFLSVEAVGIYSVAFRIAAIALLPYALINAGLYARVYSLRTRQFDRWAPMYLGASALVGLTIVVAFSWLLSNLAPKAVNIENRALAQSIIALVMGQVIGWMISGSIFLRINRTGLASQAAVVGGLVAAVTVAGFFGLWQAQQISLAWAAFLLLAQEYAQIAALILLLWRRGLPLPRLALFSALIAGTSIALHLMGVAVAH